MTNRTAEELSYRWAHEDAVEMGYPSLTEALEHLSELRASPTPDPSAYVLPCDVKLPPATTIKAGCTLSTLLAAFGLEGRPEHFAASPTPEPCNDAEELREERDALLERPISLAKMDSIDEDATDKMVAYYWWQQAQNARAEPCRLREALERIAASKLTPGSRYNERMRVEYESVVDLARAALSASPAEPQEATEAMIEAIKDAAFNCAQPISRRTAAAIYAALRSAASGGDTV